MEEESSIDLKKPLTNKQFFIAMAFLCLLAGLCLGIIIGGMAVQNNWEEWNEIEQERIKQDCTCINRTIGGFNYEIEKYI